MTERAPVAQMSNGLPYVGPPKSPESNSTGGEILAEAMQQGASVVTVWSTATVTSIQVQTSILTSIVVSIATTFKISTATIDILTPSISDVFHTESKSIPTSTDAGYKTATSAFTTNTFSMSTSTSLPASSIYGNASSSEFLSVSPSPTTIIPSSSESDSAELIHRVSNHASLIKTMGALVAGIFILTAIMSLGLYIKRRKSEKVSEIEAAKTAQRQEQPLMNEPIVPYSSAYGTNL